MRKRKGRRDDDDDDDDDDENARVLSDDSLSPSSLWEAIVKWDDVSFKEIISQEGVEEEVSSERDVVDIDFGMGVGESIVELAQRRRIFLLASCSNE